MRLNRPEIYLGTQKATKHVVSLAKALNIQVPKPKDFGSDIILSSDKKSIKVNFKEEIEYTKNIGKANMLQALFDSKDRFLQPAIEMSASGDTPGIRFHLESTVGRHTARVTNHGAIEAPEQALARDICFYHKETCDLYNSRDTQGFSRSFRGYLHSCVSLVDCFLFRYAFHIRELIPDPSQYINTLTLESRSSVLERLEAWVQTFSPQELDGFNNWKERSQFIELKDKRNEFTHPSVPSVSFEPNDVAKYLNYGASGVGKLLGKMRNASSVSDKIGFIVQVSSLPIVKVTK